MVQRRGYTAREFDLDDFRDRVEKQPFEREYSAEEIWANYTYFIKAVLPVAEKAGVKLALHPDDPPVAKMNGVAKLFTHYDGYRRAEQIAGNSRHWGLTFCVGTWSEGGDEMGKNVFEMIRDFGSRGKIFEVHFRNVTGPLAALRRDLPRRRLHGHVPGDESPAAGSLQRRRGARPCPRPHRRQRHRARRHGILHRLHASPTAPGQRRSRLVVRHALADEVPRRGVGNVRAFSRSVADIAVASRVETRPPIAQYEELAGLELSHSGRLHGPGQQGGMGAVARPALRIHGHAKRQNSHGNTNTKGALQ